jgi:hypothetical protein
MVEMEMTYFRLWDLLKLIHKDQDPASYEWIHHVVGETWWNREQATAMLALAQESDLIEIVQAEEGERIVQFTPIGQTLADRIVAVDQELERLEGALEDLHMEGKVILIQLVQKTMASGTGLGQGWEMPPAVILGGHPSDDEEGTGE